MDKIREKTSHHRRAIKSRYIFEALADEVGKDCDPFDLLCHVAWDMPPSEKRAEQVKKQNYFTNYGEKARIVLEALLDKYADEGIVQIEQLDFNCFTFYKHRNTDRNHQSFWWT